MKGGLISEHCYAMDGLANYFHVHKKTHSSNRSTLATIVYRPFSVHVSYEQITTGQILMDNMEWDMKMIGPSSFRCHFPSNAILKPNIQLFPQFYWPIFPVLLRNSVHLLDEK